MAHDRKRQAALAQTRQSMIGTGNIMSQTLSDLTGISGTMIGVIHGALYPLGEDKGARLD